MKTLKDQSNNGKNKMYEKIKQEKISDADIRELMGMNQATYRRHKGAIRRK